MSDAAHRQTRYVAADPLPPCDGAALRLEQRLAVAEAAAFAGAGDGPPLGPDELQAIGGFLPQAQVRQPSAL